MEAMTMSQDKIIDRLRKLLALSRSSNEHEAAAAAGRAAELMREHRIEEAQLEVDGGASGEEPIDKVAIDESARSIVHWKSNIANGLARSQGCRMWWRGAAIMILGRPSQVSTIRYMYGYLCSEIERLANEAWERAEAACVSETARRWKHSFRLGASSVVEARLMLERREHEIWQKRAEASNGDTRALVLVRARDEEVAEAYETMSKGFRRQASGPAHSSSGGYAAGARAGQAVSLGASGPRLGAPARKITEAR